MQRCRLAMDADVGDVATRADDVGAELERLRDPDGFDRDIDADAVGELEHTLACGFTGDFDRVRSAALDRAGEPLLSHGVDHDDPTGREQERGQDGSEPDRAGTDDGDRVAGLEVAVEHPNLEARRQDVGQEQHLLVGEGGRNLVDGGVGERDPRVLRLHTVDQVAEDPTAATGAQAVAGCLALLAAAARGDARREHTVADRDRRNGLAHLGDRADRFVAEDRPRLHRRHVALENVQVAAADGGSMAPDDDVGRGLESAAGNVAPPT